MAEKRLTVFHNARVRTVDELVPEASWFAVLGDRFQRVGVGPAPEAPVRVDLGGRTVVPGFVDAHAHFFQTGLDLLFVNLSGCRTVQEIGARLRPALRGRRTWIFAHSFEEDGLSDVPRLTSEHIDEIAPQQPVWINRIDYHSAVANTTALRRLEVPLGTPGLLTDKKGQPNGILRSEAYFFAKARISRLYPIETRERAVKTAADACIRNGITAVHALEGGRIFGDEGVSTLLKRLHNMPLDVTLFIQEKNVFFTSRLGFRHLGGCILIDGSIGSYTAALDFDYEGAKGQRGVLYEKPRELEAFIEEAHVTGVQLAFHALGPRAIEQVLRAYESAQRKAPRYDHRHRIEHFELATDEQISRARDLGVVCSMQPAFEYYWGGPNGMYASRIGEAWRRTNRIRSVREAGIVCPGGSDTNVTPPIPLLGIHAAVNHPNEEQRIDVAAALRMMTIDAAYAAFNEARHGSIAVGKEASFVVLDRDLYECPSGELKDIQVLETWFRGRRVFPAPRAAAAGVPPAVGAATVAAHGAPGEAPARAAPKRIFVIGWVEPYVSILEPVARRRGWELLPLLNEDRFDGHDGYPVAEMLDVAAQREREVGPVDAIVAYRDFPECTLVPDLAAKLSVRGPSLEAMLKCEHKHWSRLEQAKVLRDHIPRFEAFDVFDPNAAANLRMVKPFWVKPVKSFASHLGFRVENDEDLERALDAIRRGVRRVSDPFAAFVARAVGAPAELTALGAGACLAESLIGGRQCTLEGCVQGAVMTTLGVVDSIRRPGSSTFLRYQYPSALPRAVTDRMADLSARLIRQIGLDHTAFNIEYFWDEERDHIWLLEINNRIAPHHALLFDSVDGRTNFEAAIDVALGQPVTPKPGGRSAMAACCFLRQYRNARVTRAPTADRVREIESEADCRIELRVQTGDELASMVEQETYSYICGLVYVTGADEREITARFEDVERRLDIHYEPIE